MQLNLSMFSYGAGVSTDFFKIALLTQSDEYILSVRTCSPHLSRNVVFVCVDVCVNFYIFLKLSYKYFKKDYSSYTEFKCNLCHK